MASPLELVLVVPATAALSLAALRFVHAIERAWNTKKRIRLEGLELDRKIYEEQVARELARERYDQLRLSGFSLESGFIRFPEDWDWPKNC